MRPDQNCVTILLSYCLINVQSHSNHKEVNRKADMCTLKAYLSIALRFEKNLNLILTLVKRTLNLKFGILHSEEEVIMILTI